ncbi:uncharacterized protein METZ01_LOCUS479580, partial [marine metagenome]
KASFCAIDRFRKSHEREENFINNILVDEDDFTICTAILEHRVPCLGFTMNGKLHVNIRKGQLKKMNYPSGSWLNELKQCVYDEKPDNYVLRVPSEESGGQEKSLGELKEDLVSISPGQKIAYVVDTVYSEQNKARIVELVKDADVFFCEAPFLSEEEDRGLERCHLTARQAGLIAGEANVKKLNVFHFSGRHTFRTEQLVQEAEEAFREKSNQKIPEIA